MGAMHPPEFIGSSFSRCGFTYGHLDQDEWAATMLNLTVAACESDLRPQLDAWSLSLPVWHVDVAEQLDPEGDLLGEAPPPWKAAVSYARSVMETVGDVVIARAKSADELVMFSALLGYLEWNFGAHFFLSHLNSWENPEDLEPVFHQFLHTELRSFREELVRKAWQKYHARLNGELQSGRDHSGAADAKASIRSSVVSPILAAKHWTTNK